ncbi:SPOR domain-containing protein [Vibrio gallicus]|uniref:SPOR domain-containing protein n=1 Tax=Vibrio gallicus TaxID=190897 RepID=UPI0021C34C1D|nr:SPOR domain-containing protein [Vibrio gallicus]
MSLIHKLKQHKRVTSEPAKWLELETQSHLLEQLNSGLQFGSSLVIISGATGAGKSTISQRFFVEFHSAKHRGLIQCKPKLSMLEFKLQLFEQLVSEYAFDPALSLYENLDQAFGLESHRMLLVIDDAGIASTDILSELWGLVERLTAHPTLSIHLVLSATPELQLEKINPLQINFNVRPRVITIPCLSSQDKDLFLDILVLRRFDNMAKRDQIRKRYRHRKVSPGQLNHLGTEEKVSKKMPSNSRGSVKYGLLLAVVVALIGCFVWWWLAGDNMQSQQVEAESKSTSAITELTMAQGEAQPHEMEPIKPDTLQVDDAALPPPVLDKTVTVGKSSNGRQRVIVPEQVLDGLIDSDNQVTKPVVEPVTPRPAVSFSFSRDALLAVSSKRYTVQLAALKNMQEVEGFIEQYHVVDRVRIYPTIRSNKQWYIITYQDFKTVSKAQSAISKLSADIQNLGPWVKSMSQVHKEIEIGK